MPHRRAPSIYHNPQDAFIPYLKENYLNKNLDDPRQAALDDKEWTDKQKAVIVRTLPTKKVEAEVPQYRTVHVASYYRTVKTKTFSYKAFVKGYDRRMKVIKKK